MKYAIASAHLISEVNFVKLFVDFVGVVEYCHSHLKMNNHTYCLQDIMNPEILHWVNITMYFQRVVQFQPYCFHLDLVSVCLTPDIYLYNHILH